MKVIIDRFEGDFAVVELGASVLVNMPRVLLPTGANEGDVISIEIDTDETKARRDKIAGLMKDVWSD